MKFSIIIPTYNRRAVLARVLTALLEQDYPAREYEIIVVVDGSTDGTPEMLREARFARVQVITQPNSGPAVARDAGVARAQGEYLLFLDDDILCPPTLLAAHASMHELHRDSFVHGRLRLAPDSPLSLMYRNQADWYEEFYGPAGQGWGILPPRILGLVNSSVARTTFVALCQGDRMPYPREEFELAIRMYKAGVPFFHSPDALAYEYYVKPVRKFTVFDGRTIGRAELAVCNKYPEFRKYCALAHIGEGKPGVRHAMNLLLRSHFPLALIFAPAIAVAEMDIRTPAIRRLGEKLVLVELGLQIRSAAAEVVGGYKQLRAQFGMRLPVLMYHHIGPSYDGTYPFLTVSPERFRQQIEWLLAASYQFITPRQWRDWVEHGTELPDNPILLTIDDAYADLAQHAFPFLCERRIPATVFVPTAHVGECNRWDEIPGASNLKVLSADQIREWSRRGIEFGAHSRTHAHLDRLSVAEARAEIEGSKRDLEQITGTPVTSFAYPYGDLNDGVAEIVRATYDVAFTTREGMNVLATDRALLLRTPVFPSDGRTTLLSRASSGYNLFTWIRQGVRNRIFGRLEPAHAGS